MPFHFVSQWGHTISHTVQEVVGLDWTHQHPLVVMCVPFLLMFLQPAVDAGDFMLVLGGDHRCNATLIMSMLSTLAMSLTCT